MGRECGYQFEHGAYGCAVETPNDRLRNIDVVIL
jgi:hypothetical protein